ncbi:MAG: hypothetical protein ACYC9X_04270, partial [Dehalococcoidia bacterium]
LARDDAVEDPPAAVGQCFLRERHRPALHLHPSSPFTSSTNTRVVSLPDRHVCDYCVSALAGFEQVAGELGFFERKQRGGLLP